MTTIEEIERHVRATRYLSRKRHADRSTVQLAGYWLLLVLIAAVPVLWALLRSQ